MSKTYVQFFCDPIDYAYIPEGHVPTITIHFMNVDGAGNVGDITTMSLPFLDFLTTTQLKIEFIRRWQLTYNLPLNQFIYLDAGLVL